MTICFLPGLGFDHRIFQKLELPGFEQQYLDWIEPDGKESVEQYAFRLAQPINSIPGKIVLIGHSLGGILAQEISKFKQIDRIILLSSVKSRKEIPLFFRMMEPSGLYHLFTKKNTLRTFPMWGKAHDYVTEEEQALFKSMVSKQSDTYLQWALCTLSTWQRNLVIPSTSNFASTYQIHGDQDKTFPVSLLKQPDVIIKGAGHFMVYREARQVSEAILSNLL